MSAVRRLHVKQYDYESPAERYTVQIALGGKPVPGVQLNRISSVDEEVMRWRKANHIHGWFVDNVQNGLDDCRDYYVEDDSLRKLLAVCQTVIKSSKLVNGSVLVSKQWNSKLQTWDELREPGKVIEDQTAAKRFLPAREGFFFGDAEYDERYLNEVIRTRDWAERTLHDNYEGAPGEIMYSSSW